jgi:hypothetical protein
MCEAIAFSNHTRKPGRKLEKIDTLNVVEQKSRPISVTVTATNNLRKHCDSKTVGVIISVRF